MCRFNLTAFLLLGLTLWVIFPAQAQTNYKPSVIPPSPNAATLGKYGDIPVSTYTGTTEITVPIYTIQLRGLSLPISLSYHTGGIKLGEESGWVGLGWTLNAGGIVSRTIMDKDDFKGMYFTSAVPQISSDMTGGPTTQGQPYVGPYGYEFLCNYLVNTAAGTLDFTPAFSDGSFIYDMEADVFTFNFLGRSGKFNLSRDKKVILQKQENLKVEFDPNGSYFIITDELGNKYYFLDVESTQTATGTNPHNSSWYLSKIVTQQKDSICFNYLIDNSWTTVKGPTSEMYNTGNCNFLQGKTTMNDVGQSYFNRTLQSIDYSNGQVQFSFDGNRTDLQNGKKLNAVRIYSKDKSGTLSYLKESQLYYSYFNPMSGPSSDPLEFQRLRLDSVKAVSGSAIENPYVFSYYMPASGQSNMGKKSSSIDHWGYFNNAYNSQFTPPFEGNVSFGNGSVHLDLDGANRNPDSTYMKAFILQKVQYPTGGSTVLEYESNFYDRSNSRLGPQEFAYEETVDSTADVVVTTNGSFSGTVNLQPIYGTNVTLSLAFRAGSMDSLRYYHLNNGYGKILFTFQNNTTDISSSNLDSNGTYPVLSANVPLNITSAGTYPWSAYIDPAISMGDSGFMDMRATFTWKEYKFSSQTQEMASGLRVKSITDYTVDGIVAKRKRYDYGYYQDKTGSGTPQPYSYGRSLSYISYGHYEHFPKDANGNVCTNFVLYSSSLVSLAGVGQGTIVGYDQVAEYTVDPATGQDNGKSVYYYHNSPDTPAMFSGFRLPGTLNIYDNLNGSLLSKIDYRNIGHGYAKVAETANYYHTANRIIYFYPKYKLTRTTSGASLSCLNGTCEPEEVLATFYPFKSERVLLDSTTQSIYDPNGNAVVATTYQYYDNPLHYQLTRSRTIDSKGNVHTTLLKYPQDYLNGSSTGNIVLDSMIAKNYVSPPIEKQDSIYVTGSGNGAISEAQATTYKLQSGSVVLDKQYKMEVASPLTNFQPLSISGGNFLLENRYRQLASIDNYDNNYNISQYTTLDGLPVSFIWDYQSRYPVAQVTRATQDQIAYTSFEADGTGGWSGIASANILGGTSVTGDKYLNQTSFSISKAGLNSTSSYIISYWSKNGAYGVSGTQAGYPKQLATITLAGQSWTYYEHLVTGITTATLTGSGALDELRLYPSAAQMTTFTYKPLIGITSQCDLNNRTSYYEYDPLGRLKVIRDKDWNIVKTYDYHYKTN